MTNFVKNWTCIKLGGEKYYYLWNIKIECILYVVSGHLKGDSKFMQSNSCLNEHSGTKCLNSPIPERLSTTSTLRTTGRESEPLKNVSGLYISGDIYRYLELLHCCVICKSVLMQQKSDTSTMLSWRKRAFTLE